MSDDLMNLEALNAYVLDQEAAINQFFLFASGTIVLMMQTGFAFQEAGLVQEKNVVNILIKNLLDACVGCWLYWLVGYGLAYGEPNTSENSFAGTTKFALNDVGGEEYASFFFQYTFAATAATIVSGTLAERVSFYAYLIYGAVLCAFIYPPVTHWGWTSTGWLATLGYKDFAGSGLVHMVGGTAALTGAFVLGPRQGRYAFETGKDGKTKRVVKDLPKHSVPFAILGTFVLFFGFLAFNGGSQLAVTPSENVHVVMKAVVNTVIAGSSGALVCLFVTAAFTKFTIWSIMQTSCGCLGGMVSICAGANAVPTWGAFIIGSIGGLIAVIMADINTKIGADDPVDAIAIHLYGGMWGALSVGFFHEETGVFFGGDGYQIAYQLAGICAVFAWTAGTITPIYLLLNYFNILRVPHHMEINGLDKKHGEQAYDMSKSFIGTDAIRQELSKRHIELKAAKNDEQV